MTDDGDRVGEGCEIAGIVGCVWDFCWGQRTAGGRVASVTRIIESSTESEGWPTDCELRAKSMLGKTGGWGVWGTGRLDNEC